MPDPIQQGLDIPDRETALRRLDLLQQNILRLREEIPALSNIAGEVRQYLSGVDKDTQTLIQLVDQLLERQRTWQDWLASRLTLLANLKLFLEMENNEDDLPWDDVDHEEEGGA